MWGVAGSCFKCSYLLACESGNNRIVNKFVQEAPVPPTPKHNHLLRMRQLQHFEHNCYSALQPTTGHVWEHTDSQTDTDRDTHTETDREKEIDRHTKTDTERDTRILRDTQTFTNTHRNPHPEPGTQSQKTHLIKHAHTYTEQKDTHPYSHIERAKHIRQ